MWSICLRLLVLTAVCLCTLTQAQSDLFQINKRNSGKYCGRNLSNALQALCNGVYNTMFKKSDKDSEMDDGYWIPAPPVPEEPLFPFSSRVNSAQLVSGSFRRQTRGVYDECCRKSCTLKELSSYCGAN
ncbi:LIRP isoform X2 [Anabrus simplex]